MLATTALAPTEDTIQFRGTLMSTDSSTSVQVTRTTKASPGALFAILEDPSQHSKLDATGKIRGSISTDLLTKVGDVFTMNMGPDQTDNRIVEFEKDRKIGWATGLANGPSVGHRWIWEFTQNSDGTTTVTHTLDWSRVEKDNLGDFEDRESLNERMSATTDRLVTAAS